MTGPPAEVLAAFGVAGAAVAPLPGGQGRSWLATPAGPPTGPPAATAVPLVLKPVDDDLQAEEVAWLAGALADLPRALPGLRLPRDVAGADGRWVVSGWRAMTHLPGQAGPLGRWTALLATARAFAAAVAHLPRPGFLDRRTDPWAVADRGAWDGGAVDVPAGLRDVAGRLRALAADPRRQGEPGPPQLVHGDLTGNVLFAEGLPPAVIDVSPYWRPAGWAGAVVVADGLVWWDQGVSLVRAAGGDVPPGLVARAVLFRLLTAAQLARSPGGAAHLAPSEVARYRWAVDVLEAVGP